MKNNAIITAFATVLRGHIDGIVRSQCLGCMLNLNMEYHDLCTDPKAYVEQFFDDAMVLLTDVQVEVVMDEQRKVNPKLPICPSKTAIDFVLVEHIKNAIVNIC